MEVDFRNNSINIDDFPIEIDNDFLSIPIDCYRFC